MNNTSKFEIDIKRGEEGEIIVGRYLLSLPTTKSLLNVTGDERYQSDDIDFIVYSNQRENPFKIEVKYDSLMHSTNNFPYEYYSNLFAKSKGCMEKTKSDLIFFLSDTTYDCYIIETNSIRNFVNKQINIDRCTDIIGAKVLQWTRMGDNAIGFLIPLYRFQDYGINFKIVNLKNYLTRAK